MCIFCSFVRKVGPKPQYSNTLKRYACEILSKASVKSSDKRHVGELVISTCAIVSRIAARAQNIFIIITDQFCCASDQNMQLHYQVDMQVLQEYIHHSYGNLDMLILSHNTNFLCSWVIR